MTPNQVDGQNPKRNPQWTGLIARLAAAEKACSRRETNGAEGAFDWVPHVALLAEVRAALNSISASAAQHNTVEQESAAALGKERNLLRTLIDHLPDYIFVKDTQCRHLLSNRANLRVMGAATHEEIIGKTSLDYFPAEDAAQYIADDQMVLSSGEALMEREERLLSGTGEERWLLTTKVPLRDERNAIIGLVGISRDITERKRTEEALRESEARFRRVVESNMVGIFFRDKDGDIAHANDAFLRLTGYTDTDLANGILGWKEITAPEYCRRDQEALQELILTGACAPYEKEFIRKDGSRVPVIIGAAALDEAREKGVCLVIDITERKKTETALRKSEASLARAQRMAHLGSWERDLVDDQMQWSDETFRIFGLTREQGSSFEAFMKAVHPEDREALAQASRESLASGKSYNFEHRIVLPDGRIRVVAEQGEVVCDKHGIPVRFIGTVLDITNREEAQAEIGKLAAFVRFNPNAVFEFSADGTLIYSNDAARELARSLDKLHPREILPEGTAMVVKHCLGSDKAYPQMQTVLHTRTISWSFFGIPHCNVVHCYAVDITERLSLEAQLRQAQKMESIGQLAGGVAHDFNNILTVIQGNAALLKGLTKASEQAQEAADEISSAAQRAGNLTRQLLTFSRRQVLQPRNLDLNEVVSNITRMLHRILGEDITLHVNYSPALSIIHADPGMIEQVLMNLAVNSRDAMPQGGHLTLTTTDRILTESDCVEFPGARVGRFVCLHMSDTGCGIPPEILSHIFEPFFTTKKVGEGTGLGLATVYGIVKQHQGWISVSSQTGRGTAFDIFLPAVEGKPARNATVAPPQCAQGGSETILVVEDETAVRKLVRTILERYGYRVLDASSGPGALDLWREQKENIDLLLTDMVMPEGVPGQELVAKLRCDRPDLKVILTSGYSAEAVTRGLHLTKGTQFLQKPYQPAKLAQMVRCGLDEE